MTNVPRPVPLALLLALCIPLLLPATTQAARESAGHFAVRVKTAELRGNWERLWELLHPRQQAFIPRALFERCMRRLQSLGAHQIRVVSVHRRLSPVPGVTGPKAVVSDVILNVDYGRNAPSQRLTVRETRVGGAWHWIDPSTSQRDFTRINLCA
jgi:hypothetical protein